MSYTSMFHTAYDEPTPCHPTTAAHYSILEFLQWLTPTRQLYPDSKTVLQRLAVIWDKDHDARIIQVLKHAHRHSLLSPVVMVAERRAMMTIVTTGLIHDDEYRAQWEKALNQLALGDRWAFKIVHVSDAVRSGIIHDMVDSYATTYLQNIANLWGLDVEF